MTPSVKLAWASGAGSALGQTRFPDAVQRAAVHRPIRHRRIRGVCDGPGLRSPVLRRAREMSSVSKLAPMRLRGDERVVFQAPASIFASMKPEPAPAPAPGQVEAPTIYSRSTGVR
jgi:hypothetical protein